MQRESIITADADAYEGLHQTIGPHRAFGYAAMAADEAREADADAWTEGLAGDVAIEPARREP